jgi:hypothetical protein
MRTVLVLLLHLVVPILVWAGPPAAPDTKPIQDNSFLIEEAYNQLTSPISEFGLCSCGFLGHPL